MTSVSIRSTARITKANIVCAEPMPGEEDMLREFVQGLNPPLLGALVQNIFEKMKLAGQAGSLLKIETEIQATIARAKQQWLTRPKDEQTTLFRVEKKQEWQTGLYSFKGITDESFWDLAEHNVLEALHTYTRQVPPMVRATSAGSSPRMPSGALPSSSSARSSMTSS